MKKVKVVQTITESHYYKDGIEVFDLTPQEKLFFSIYCEVKTDNKEIVIGEIKYANKKDLHEKLEFFIFMHPKMDDWCWCLK